MRDDIDKLITMLRTDVQASCATALGALDELSGEMTGATDDGGVSQTSLLAAIKSQVGVVLSEVERYDSAITGQLGIAQNYAQSLTKGE